MQKKHLRQKPPQNQPQKKRHKNLQRKHQMMKIVVLMRTLARYSNINTKFKTWPPSSYKGWVLNLSPAKNWWGISQLAKEGLI